MASRLGSTGTKGQSFHMGFPLKLLTSSQAESHGLFDLALGSHIAFLQPYSVVEAGIGLPSFRRWRIDLTSEWQICQRDKLSMASNLGSNVEHVYLILSEWTP